MTKGKLRYGMKKKTVFLYNNWHNKMQNKYFCTSINGCWNHSFDCNDGMDCRHQGHHRLLLLDWIGLTGGYWCHHYYSFRERTTIGISITWKYDSHHLWDKLIISFSDTRFWTKHPKHQIIFVVLQQHLRLKYQDDHPQILSYRHQLVTKCCFRVAKAKPDKQNYQMRPPFEVFGNPTIWGQEFHELGSDYFHFFPHDKWIVLIKSFHGKLGPQVRRMVLLTNPSRSYCKLQF